MFMAMSIKYMTQRILKTKVMLRILHVFGIFIYYFCFYFSSGVLGYVARKIEDLNGERGIGCDGIPAIGALFTCQPWIVGVSFFLLSAACFIVSAASNYPRSQTFIWALLVWFGYISISSMVLLLELVVAVSL